MTVPRLSVIMPVRDGARWIDAAASSVLGQSVDDLELIIIDDGSTDETPSLLRAIGRSDARVRILRQTAKGLVGALNAGIDLARAPVLARLDADDIALPGRFERQLERLDARPQIVLVGSWAEKIDATGRSIGLLQPESDPVRLAGVLRSRNPLIHSTAMMRTDLVKKVGAYREVCRHAEDYDLWLRLAEHGEIAVLPEALVQYRVHAHSISRRSALNQCFSARLASRAAAMRWVSGQDPLAGRDAPPDWWAADAATSFFGEEARLFRFLDFGTVVGGPRLVRQDVAIPSPAMFATLTHEEKKFARRAIRRLLASPGRPATLKAGTLIRQALHGAFGWRFQRAPTA